jgi:hypothetical protein
MKDIRPLALPRDLSRNPACREMTDGAPSLVCRGGNLGLFYPVSKTGGVAKTNSRGMRVNSLQSPQCEVNPWNEASRMLLGITQMSDILSQWKDRGKATSSCGRLGDGGWHRGSHPRHHPGGGQEAVPTFCHPSQCFLPHYEKIAWLFNRSYQRSPCSW